MSTTIDKAPSEALSLFLDRDEKGQVDSSVPVRWCISRETAEMIEAKGILDPQLVIVIEQDGIELERYVVPLEEQMRYIQFRRPGESVIRATIVWPRNEDAESVKRVLTGRFDNGQYKADLVRHEQPSTERLRGKLDELEQEKFELDADSEDPKESSMRLAAIDAEQEQLRRELNFAVKTEGHQVMLRQRFDELERLEYEFQLGVMVPEEMFAKEPPRWMKWLGTRYSHWNGAARDQCDLRRRALFTGITLPFYWVGKAIGLIVMTALVAMYVVAYEACCFVVLVPLLLFGKRGIDYGVLLDMPDGKPAELYRSLEPSVWLWRRIEKEYKDGDKYYMYESRKPVFLVLNPPAALVLVAIGCVLYLTLNESLAEIIAIVMAALFIAAVALIGVTTSESSIEARAKRRQEAKTRQQTELRKDLEQLACSNTSHEVKVSALPKGRRTVALRFQAAKAVVCKPFAR